MKDSMSHPKIINIIAQIYQGDKTFINYGNVKDAIINITSGIRQGCTGSTSLFKLITFKIIERMEKEKGFSDELFKLIILFYADDGLLLANSLRDAERNIDVLINISRECGLEINLDKSNILIFNQRNQPVDIKGIKVVNNLKYLGVTLNNGRDCFKIHKQNMFKKAKRLANQTYPVIAKSCNKILIGKTFWKSLALPSILYGANIVELTKTDIEKLQTIENSVYRQILNAPCYAQKSALRGEIGASSMKARIMEGKIKLLQYTKSQGDESLLGRITMEMKSMKKCKWTVNMAEYLKETGIKYNELDILTKDEIKSKVQHYDTKEWKAEVRSKKSLEIYEQYKTEIGGNDEDYDNTPASVTLYKARTNILPLNDRNRFRTEGNDTKCQICESPFEDLEHFLIYCPQYTEIRNGSIELQQPYIENTNNIIGQFLFCKSNFYSKKKVLQEMWKSRERKIKTLQNV